MSLDAKLELFDEHADEAVDRLIDWLTNHRRDVIAVARGRHVTGHHLYGNANFAEWGPNRLRKETLEELADGVVYTSREIALEKGAAPL